MPLRPGRSQSEPKGPAPLARLAEDPKKLSEQKDLPAGMLTAALVAKTGGAAPAHDGPAGTAAQAPTVLFTGITNGQKDADQMWQKLANTGGFAAPKDPHAVAAYGSIAEAPGWLGHNPTARNVGDAGLDVQAVAQYFHAAEGIQVDSAGNLKIDAATQKGLNAAHDNLGEKYVSAAELGRAGANQALSQLKPAPTFDPKTGKLTDEKAANQFISVLGHSGGGQGAFYTAIDLYQKGFKNVAVNGYEMALSPHERDVLEKIGVKVTNISGHLGDGAQVDSGIGEGLRDAVGKGDPNYYDVNLRLDGKNPLGLHSIGDKAASMLMYSAWLDSQGRHHQFNDGSYKQWLAATGAQYGADQSAAKGSETAGFNRPQDLLDGARFTNRVPVSNNLADRSIQLGAGPLGASGNAYAGGQLGAAQGRWDGARGSGSVDNASVSFGASGQASALGRTLAGQVSGGAAVGVVLASGGYPGSYETGKPIDGLDEGNPPNTEIFQAGTRRDPNGEIVTTGGRVLTVVGFPTATVPGILDDLNRLAFHYRWSTRALAAKSVKSWMKAVWMTASAAAAPRCRLSRSASEPRCTAAPAAASERAPASERASPRT